MPADDRLRPRTPVAAGIGVAVAVFAALLPSLRVIQAGPWLAGSALLIALVIGAGLVVRRLRGGWALAVLAQAVVWMLTVTGLCFRDLAWFAVIPSPAVVEAVPALVRQTLEEMAVGVPPLPATAAVSFFFIGAAGLLTLVMDYVVVTTRLPLLGSLALLTVALAPSVAVAGRVDAWAFALLAASILFMLWTENRTRNGRGSRVRDAAPLAAVAVGAVAVVVALVVTPLLPPPDQRVIVGGGGSTGIDPTLAFGDDLRRPNPVEVLRVRTSVASAPYLRATTSSTFDGDTWQPDSGDLDPVGSGRGFGQVNVDETIDITRVDTHISVEQLNTPYLPVAFPATAIDGLTGRWGILQANRTVQAIDAGSAGQTFEVLSSVPRPSLQQIRAARTAGTGADDLYTALPDDTPAIVRDLARQVTADTANPFDAAEALQDWFRSDEFGYSLDAPVSGQYDGSGAEAIGEFLEVREGYCIHFASAFAMMTRSLGMPTRVVVGYLPGIATGEMVDDDTVYAVSSDQLHSWPEVYFDGIGWIGFEPTNSLGAPPTFTSSGTSAADQLDAPAAEQTAAPTASAGPTRPAEDLPTAAPSGTVTSTAGASPAILLGIAGAVIVVALAVPGIAGLVRRRVRARRGSAAAAWSLVQDTALDLGIRVPGSETPREFGARMVDAGAPPEAIGRLTAAVERASFAPAGDAGAPDPDAVAAARASRRGMLRASSPGRRVSALLAPRSLVIRPGSTLASR